MKRGLILSLTTVFLTGCPDTDKYNQGAQNTGDNTGGGTAFIPAGGQVVSPGGVTTAGTTAGAIAPGGEVVATMAGSIVAGGAPNQNSGGMDAVGGVMGGSTGVTGGDAVSGGAVAGGTIAGGGQPEAGGTAAAGGNSNPFALPAGGQGSSDIPEQCTVRFVVTTPASTPAGEIFIAGTFKQPNPQDIPMPTDDDEWTMNGDCKNPIPAGADPNALRCNWNPGDPQLRLDRSGNSATFEYELPHLSRVEYKFTRGAWCAVEKTGACAELATNRRYTVNCAGENPKIVQHTIENWNDVCMNAPCL